MSQLVAVRKIIDRGYDLRKSVCIGCPNHIEDESKEQDRDNPDDPNQPIRWLTWGLGTVYFSSCRPKIRPFKLFQVRVPNSLIC